MTETTTKLRCLINMKTILTDALQKELDTQKAKTQVLMDANQALCSQNESLIHQLETLQLINEQLNQEQWANFHKINEMEEQLKKQQEEWWTQQDQDDEWIEGVL